MHEDLAGGWSPTRVLEWVLVGAVSLPVVAGFVALGAAVVVGRTMRDAAMSVWGWIPSRTTDVEVPPVDTRSNAA